MAKASTLTDDRDDRMQSPSNDSLILYGHVDIIAFAINSEWRCFECDRNIRRTKRMSKIGQGAGRYLELRGLTCRCLSSCGVLGPIIL